MDLVQTVRKEGSRGGRADFKWEDVKNDAQRENYLGHSLMAPVGRWQQGRDLGWYAKGDGDDKEAEAARIAEEKRKIKQAEEDAMLVAMGLPVPIRDNANLTPLGTKAHEADVQNTLEAKARDDQGAGDGGDKKERSRRHRDRHGERKRRHRSRSRSHDRERRHRHRRHSPSPSRHRPRHDDRGDRHRHRSRSREHRRRDEPEEPPRAQQSHRRPSLSPSRERRRRRDTRSRSPYAKDKRRD